MGGVIGGCAGTAEPVAAGPVVVHDDRHVVWTVSKAELKRRGFRLDRADRRLGVLETLPRTSSQWFEFWGQDVVTGAERAEASLHTVRRKVLLKLAPVADKQTELQCRVIVEREYLQPAVVGGSVRVADVLIDRPSGPQGQSSGRSWGYLDDDHALAGDIVRSIAVSLGE